MFIHLCVRVFVCNNSVQQRRAVVRVVERAGSFIILFYKLDFAFKFAIFFACVCVWVCVSARRWTAVRVAGQAGCPSVGAIATSLYRRR
ncbi:hypothetical protein T492DRAFT_1016642 [Pavlovales sp. CCMP2436]|nr:hypothetical protein T492DRAFT_1016642 [Pavlovales sp. CCMP2436]